MQRDQIAAVDAGTLQPRERFDREYLLAVVDKDLFWIEKTQFPFSNPGWYLDQIDPDMYLSRNYAPLDVRMKAYIKYAQGIPKIAASIKENLKSPMPKTYVELGIDEFGGLADFYTKNVAAVFAVGVRRRSAKAAERRRCGGGAGDERPQGLPGRRAQERQRQICTGSGPVCANGQADRASGSAGRADRGRGPRRSRPQHGGPESRVRHLRAEGVPGAMRGKDGREQTERRTRRGSAQSTQDAQGVHRPEQRGVDSEQ